MKRDNTYSAVHDYEFSFRRVTLQSKISLYMYMCSLILLCTPLDLTLSQTSPDFYVSALQVF